MDANIVEAVKEVSKGKSKKDFYKRETGIRIHCKRCGYKYFISDDTLKWYKDNGLEEPKRCYACRSKDRNEKVKEG